MSLKFNTLISIMLPKELWQYAQMMNYRHQYLIIFFLSLLDQKYYLVETKYNDVLKILK